MRVAIIIIAAATVVAAFFTIYVASTHQRAALPLAPVVAFGTTCMAKNSNGDVVTFPARDGACYSADTK